MQDQPTHGPAQSGGELDDQLQMAVLTHLLLAYPASLTLDELTTAFLAPFETASWWEVDGVRRAVRDLVCSGLLRASGEAVVPTQATARFTALQGL